MSPHTPQPVTEIESDPMIDQIREIRGKIGERTGHDLDRLFDELRLLERQFAQRQGVFSGVSQEAAARVEASWGDLSGPERDPMIDEVRARRSNSRPARS